MWKALRHQNILPLLGVTMSKNQFTMVSEWMINGNINEFIKVHRDANRFDLVGFYSYYIPYLSLMKSLLIAQRYCSWIDIFAWSGDDPWRFERGMISSASRYPAH